MAKAIRTTPTSANPTYSSRSHHQELDAACSNAHWHKVYILAPFVATNDYCKIDGKDCSVMLTMVTGYALASNIGIVDFTSLSGLHGARRHCQWRTLKKCSTRVKAQRPHLLG